LILEFEGRSGVPERILDDISVDRSVYFESVRHGHKVPCIGPTLEVVLDEPATLHQLTGREDDATFRVSRELKMARPKLQEIYNRHELFIVLIITGRVFDKIQIGPVIE
jgi:hypothetical protein